MKAKKLEITLTLVGPVLTHATATGEAGIDSPFLKAPDGRYALPATLIKGRLRQAWDELVAAGAPGFNPNVVELLGLDCAARSNNAPERGRLQFNGYFCAPHRPTNVRHRIAIDHERGSVAHGALQVLEAPFAPGEEVEFSGEVPFFAADDQKAAEIAAQVKAGLQWVSAVGGLKGSGFGRIKSVKVIAADAVHGSAAAGDLGRSEVIDLELQIHEPFCISVNQPDQNFFESNHIIPGGVLKGAIASTWRALLGLPPSGEVTGNMDSARGDLCRAFESIRILHAMPCRPSVSGRPAVLPQSLAAAFDRVFDVALESAPLVARKTGTGGTEYKAPAFHHDWKQADRTNAEQVMALEKPNTYLRTRSAHDRVSNRALDKALFSLETIRPEGFVWRSRIVMPEDAPEAARRQLADVLGRGLHFIGKTKATAKVKLAASSWGDPGSILDESLPAIDLATAHRARQADPPARTAAEAQGQAWIITLQTPALLLDPKPLAMRHDQEALAKAYRAVWAELSDNALELGWYYAGHSMAGGGYLHRRFADPRSPYSPYLLTDAGSVFVLRPIAGREADARGVLAAWSRDGLDLPGWLDQQLGGASWRNCPYVPENGFGEIAVNHEVHLRPIEGVTLEAVTT